MPRPFPLLRSLRTTRRITPPRRPFTTTTFRPSAKSFRLPIITGTVVLGLGVGLYSLSRESHAEIQSSKIVSGKENREGTARVSRKREQRGNAVKESNQLGGSSQDNKPSIAVSSKKSDSEADEDSKPEKIKGGHHDSGQPKDERINSKSGNPETMEGDTIEENQDEVEAGGPIGISR
jgi:hypothetical protein